MDFPAARRSAMTLSMTAPNAFGETITNSQAFGRGIVWETRRSPKLTFRLIQPYSRPSVESNNEQSCTAGKGEQGANETNLTPTNPRSRGLCRTSDLALHSPGTGCH